MLYSMFPGYFNVRNSKRPKFCHGNNSDSFYLNMFQGFALITNPWYDSPDEVVDLLGNTKWYSYSNGS